jgi:1-acyl-sn-glycerol-3-phosphate acyltransferase
MEASEKFLDIEGIIQKKNPKLLQLIPGCVVRYLKNVLHQDDLNDIIYKNRDNYGVDFVDGALAGFGTKFEAFGLENVPSSGRFIFASNHPLGGLDGLIFMSVVRQKFPELKFIVNDLLLFVKNLEPVFIPVNKLGRQSANYAGKIESAYTSDEQILYFPAGLCSRKIKGQITDLPWHKSFITKAVKYQRDVIPVYFEGRNSNFFYNLSNFRKLLGIKANIEMFYLVDEMFKQHKKYIRLYFGKPIPYGTFDHSKTPVEWANTIRATAYALPTKFK